MKKIKCTYCSKEAEAVSIALKIPICIDCLFINEKFEKDVKDENIKMGVNLGVE